MVAEKNGIINTKITLSAWELIENEVSYVDDSNTAFLKVSNFFLQIRKNRLKYKKQQGGIEMIEVTSDAARWFKQELGLESGQSVRLFARYSAGGAIHPGFSLGIQADEPVSPGISSESEGITFYMEDHDKWYLDGYNLKVVYNAGEDDIEYAYMPESTAAVSGDQA